MESLHWQSWASTCRRKVHFLFGAFAFWLLDCEWMRIFPTANQAEECGVRFFINALRSTPRV
jgi:hypothetical protein